MRPWGASRGATVGAMIKGPICRCAVPLFGISVLAFPACGVNSGVQPSGEGSGGQQLDGAGGRSDELSGIGGSPSGGATSAAGGSGGAASSGGSSDHGAGGDSAATGGMDGSGGLDAGSGGQGSSLPPTTNYAEEGPFETVVENGQGPGAGYMIVRPEPLGDDSFLHAPLVFGPGIGQQASVHTTMLRNFASHGFVVVGTPVLEQGPGGDDNYQKMLDGLEWILEQNEQTGKYQGKLWADHAVSMGFSVGGTAAVELGGHPAVLTVVSIHGHTASAELHGTMLQTTGTMDTVGMPLQQATYASSMVPTFLATLTGASHGYIEQNGGGEQRPAIVAWMRYWIYGDEGAAPYFFGDTCTLCSSPWENPQRKNWP